jgi:hypothetical protein
MAEDFTKDFVDLSNWCLGAHSATKLSFNHGESGFDIRPLVIMLHERFTVVIVEMPHAIPKAIEFMVMAVHTRGVDFERDKRRAAHGLNNIKILSGRISLVGRNFVDKEHFSRVFDKRWEMNTIMRLVSHDLNACDNMRFDTAHYMRSYPSLLAAFLAPLVVKPSGIGGSGEAGRIDSEVFFYCTKRTCALLDESFKQRRKFGVFKIACITGERRRLGNQFLSFRFSQAAHKSPAGHGGVGLVDKPEYDIRERQARPSKPVFRLLNAVAQVTEQRNKMFFFMELGIIINRPILGIGYPNGLGYGFSSVRLMLSPFHKFNRIYVLAFLVCRLKMFACAKRFAVVEVDDISAVARLRRDLPAQFVLFNRVAVRNCQSSFLPLFHLTAPLVSFSLSCIYNTIHCLVLSIGFRVISRKILPKNTVNNTFYYGRI